MVHSSFDVAFLCIWLCSDLNDNTDTWALKIRVCRKWESTNPKKADDLISIDMIFIDEQENMIHAVIRKHLANRFQHRLMEGGLYSLRNLKIAASTGAYRPLSNKFKVLFLAITAVIPLEEGAIQIPKYGFEFISQNLLESRVNDNTVLSDVVGCLCAVGGIEIVGAGWKKRDIKIITDYKITLWGKLGELFDPNMYKKDGAPYVVIVTSATVKKFQGEISFCTTNGSKLYINLDTAFVASLRDRFGVFSKDVEIIENSHLNKPDPEKEMFVNRMSIRELVEAHWSEELEEYIVTVRAKIMGVDDSFGWYYVSCKTCMKKVVPRDGGHMCNACQKIVDYPLMLFKIHVKVTDGTSTTTFVLFNMVSERLLDMSVKKMLNNLSSSRRDIPLELQALVGTDLIFKLRLNHYNLRDGFANYTVIDLFHPRDELEEAYKLARKLKSGNELDNTFGVAQNADSKGSKRGKQVVSDDDKDNEDVPTSSGSSMKRRNLITDDEEEFAALAGSK